MIGYYHLVIGMGIAIDGYAETAGQTHIIVHGFWCNPSDNRHDGSEP